MIPTITRTQKIRDRAGESPHREERVAWLSDWHRLWFGIAALSAVAVSLIDGILLQRKYQIFTGGFLSINHLKDVGEITLFLAVSFISDLGVTVPLVAASLWLLSRLGLNARPSILLAIVVSVAPIAAVDFIGYQIHTYLGDAFDFALTFEIADRSPAEILAVAIPHAVAPLLFLIASGLFVVLLIWLFKRYIPGWAPLPVAPSLWRVGVETVVVLCVALLVTAAAHVASDPLDSSLKRKPSGRLFASISQRLSDLDGDGYGFVQRPLDPAPLDGSIYPYAVDIPNNGIDENGVAGDLRIRTDIDTETPPAAGQWRLRPNVILILLEGFRYDLIGKTFQEKAITPFLNELAQIGVSASAAYSHNGFTSPSRYHLFSGRLAGKRNGDSLIDDFKANGYEVAYFSAQDVSFGGGHFDVGYERADVKYDARVEPERRFTTFATPGSIGIPYHVIVEKVTDFLKQRQSERPLFLYVNFQDTHFPYYHHFIQKIISDAALARAEIGPGKAAELWATYVNTAANVDMAIGQIWDEFKRSLGDPSPGIIVTSDHGESLFDDGTLGHGLLLNDIQTQVPLVVANLPMTVEVPFGLVDVRGALNKALNNQPKASSRPALLENTTRAVFQYLGDFNRPREIALRNSSRRTEFDFRTGRYQTADGLWRRPDELSHVESEAFQFLVHYWERMVLAASTKNRGG